MHTKIKAHREYQTIEQALNVIELLWVIKLFFFNIEDKKYITQKVHETNAAFYRLRQGKTLTKLTRLNSLTRFRQLSNVEHPLEKTHLHKSWYAETWNMTARRRTHQKLLRFQKRY